MVPRVFVYHGAQSGSFEHPLRGSQASNCSQVVPHLDESSRLSSAWRNAVVVSPLQK